MKLKFKNLEKDGRGFIGLIPEEPEDMWHTYHLITVGDHVKSTTVRRVTKDISTGTISEKVRVTLEIKVETIDFDTQSGLLRLNGKVINENKYVKMGSYHTIDLELNREFSIFKSHWDSIALDRVKTATDPSKYADLGAVIFQEGLAHICFITSSMTIVRQRIEMAVPRKRRGSTTSHDKVFLSFLFFFFSLKAKLIIGRYKIF